jgi:hypothetical protein
MREVKSYVFKHSNLKNAGYDRQVENCEKWKKALTVMWCSEKQIGFAQNMGNR